MLGVTNFSLASAATCQDLTTGSLTVYVNDFGLSKVLVDQTITGGTILGPGSPTVFCEGDALSLAGDAIATHLPCPIPPTHCAAFTGGSQNVLCLDLLSLPAAMALAGAGGAGLSPNLFCAPISEPIVPYAQFPPLSNTYLGPITFVFQIFNNGAAASKPCKIGVFEVFAAPDPPAVGSLYSITRMTANGDPSIELREEKPLLEIPSGGNIAATITLLPPESMLLVGYPRWFTVAVDIDSENIELFEGDNTAPLIEVTVA